MALIKCIARNQHPCLPCGLAISPFKTIAHPVIVKSLLTKRAGVSRIIPLKSVISTKLYRSDNSRPNHKVETVADCESVTIINY